MGIGTTNPSSKLDVNGDLNVNGAASIKQNLNIDGQVHASGDVCTDAGGGKCLSNLSNSSNVIPAGYSFVPFGQELVLLKSNAYTQAESNGTSAAARVYNGQIQTRVWINQANAFNGAFGFNGTVLCDSGWVNGFNASCGAWRQITYTTVYGATDINGVGVAWTSNGFNSSSGSNYASW